MRGVLLAKEGRREELRRKKKRFGRTKSMCKEGEGTGKKGN